MIIRNCTDGPIVVAMRNVEGYDDRVELLQPGEDSDTWLHLEEEDVITIEREGRGKMKLFDELLETEQKRVMELFDRYKELCVDKLKIEKEVSAINEEFLKIIKERRVK